MTTNRLLAVLLLGSLLPATLPAAPTAVEFQGVTIGSKLKTTPVTFANKVGLAGGKFLAPGTYDVEVASTGDKSRVMLLFVQKGVKRGETPGALKLAGGPGGIDPCWKPGGSAGIVRPNCNAAKAGLVCDAKGGHASPGASSHYLSFEQLGFTGGARPLLRAGVGGGTLLTIPGAGGASVEAELPAAH